MNESLETKEFQYLLSEIVYSQGPCFIILLYPIKVPREGCKSSYDFSEKLN